MKIIIDCENCDLSFIEKVQKYFSELDPEIEIITLRSESIADKTKNHFFVGVVDSGTTSRELALEFMRNYELNTEEVINNEIIDPRKLKLNIDGGFNPEIIKKLHNEVKSQENPKRLILGISRGFMQDWINELNKELEKQIRIIKNPTLENFLFIEEKPYSSIPQKQKIQKILSSKKATTFFRRNKHL